MRVIHIITGFLGLVSGAVALYALKGGKVHRKSGMIFVYTMLLMSGTAVILAVMKPQRISIAAGLLTFYLVATALLTVRRPTEGFNWIDACAVIVALTAAILGIKFGIEGLNTPNGMLDGDPAMAGFIMSGVAFLAVFGDVRMMRQGIHGARRIARHLWRMCFALWIATASLFLGQPQVFPEPIRKSPLLMIPPLLVLLLMFYWMGRILFKRRRRANA
jgi:uncharacterized membrane protein